MKRIIVAAILLLFASLLSAEMNINFFGNNNFTMDASTTFAADINTGATGLLTEAGFGLWFEVAPFTDRNISPQRDALSVSVKLANSAFYEWRGYDDAISVNTNADGTISYGSIMPSMYGGLNIDQATSIWFNTFVAQLEYNKYWIRIAGIEPELTISQASIRSVFNPVIANLADVSKNPLPMPLFVGDANHYNGNGGVVGLLSRDIIHLNRREVALAGNFSIGMTTEIFEVLLKAGTWKKAEENTGNSWVAGGDLSWRPDLSQAINFSMLAAVNYGKVSMNKNDPMSNPEALVQNPLAFGFGYEYRFDLPKRMVIKPYAGIDFIWETKVNEYNFEFGGGLQWFFRGTNASYNRNDKIGGINLGDVDIPAAMILGINVDKNGFMNAVISFNEDPKSSPLRNVGGFLQAEFMNITGKEYIVKYKYEGNSYHTRTFDEFMFAGIIQLEYLINGKFMPYLFGKFIPADTRGLLLTDAPDYRKNRSSVTSKLGIRIMPLKYLTVDLWYERTDVRIIRDWVPDDGVISVTVGLKNYL